MGILYFNVHQIFIDLYGIKIYSWFGWKYDVHCIHNIALKSYALWPLCILQ